MPHLVLFHRKWGIGSDDFVFSGSVDSVIRFIWFTVVLVVYLIYRGELDSGTCQESLLLHVYFIGLLIFLIVTAVFAALITCISMKGTIADDAPRKRFPVFLYTRLTMALLEVIWNSFGTHLAFAGSADCHNHVINIAKGATITGWVILLILALTCVVLFSGKSKKERLPPTTRTYRRGSRRPYSKIPLWEKRCKRVFFCIGDNDNTGVFRTLAKLSSDYFKKCDLVPTDIVAGLILLSRKQELKRQTLHLFKNGKDDGNERSAQNSSDASSQVFECQPKPQAWMTLEKMSHYLKFALGSYGWPFYITLTKPLFGVCLLCLKFRCCCCNYGESSVLDDNCCMCNTAAFKETTGVHQDDIVLANFNNKIYEIPFYVTIDRLMNAVVVAVRGTLSLEDVITDLIVEREDLNIEGVQKAYVHKGIYQCASYIKRTLEEKNILEDAFSRVEGVQMDLVITGHSLGAGAAAILAILLKSKYPKVRCFAFSPPGELLSPRVTAYAEDIVCSIVLGDDIVCRQGMLMMYDLKIQILSAIIESKLPKYQILAGGCTTMCCGQCRDVNESINFTNLDDTNCMKSVEVNKSSLELCLTQSKAYSEQIRHTYQRLHLPGQILHIEHGLSGDEKFTASWKKVEDFMEIIVSMDMLSHHFPDNLQDAIDDLILKQYNILHQNTNTSDRMSTT